MGKNSSQIFFWHESSLKQWKQRHLRVINIFIYLEPKSQPFFQRMEMVNGDFQPFLKERFGSSSKLISNHLQSGSTRGSHISQDTWRWYVGPAGSGVRHEPFYVAIITPVTWCAVFSCRTKNGKESFKMEDWPCFTNLFLRRFHSRFWKTYPPLN